MKLSLAEFVAQLTPGYIYGWAKNRDNRMFVPGSNSRCLVIQCIRDHGFPNADGGVTCCYSDCVFVSGRERVEYPKQVSALLCQFDMWGEVEKAFQQLNS